MSAYVIEKEKKVTPEIEQFNQTACDYPKNRTIVELFEEQAARTPERIALTFETNNLTYAQLNEKANQLAAKLRRLGVQPNDFVAILSERGAELLIALYGILKAGAAYVPMDPTYPKERIDYMLRDCGAKAVVVYQTVVETELPTIDLSQPLEESCENLPTVNQPSDIAYLIYTSGTTGKPKAIMIEHRNVLNYCTQNGYGVFRYADGEHCESILAVTNIVFDIFVTEAIVSLLSGMTVHLANVDEQTNAEDFLALEAVCKAEVLQTTPSRLQMFLAQKPKDERYQHFKYLMLGGEAVSEQLVQRLKDVCPNARIIDVYGPSETTVWSSCADVTNGVVNIGKPISNTQIYILKQTELCPIGEIGELCIAGDGLARGYLNQPELTKEKFIDNPFGEGRLYRTGDLAKWLPDGNIEFLGRIDEQVKIRGHRIELGEIDSVLRTLSGVTDCAVIVRDEQIFAYIVSNEQIDSQSIMTELARHLPEYMLPSGMMQLNQIPITRNGKLDKRALPEIKTASKLEYIAPRNALESLCCELFAQCLGVERVGIDDNFFALGGHSIRAAWIVNRLQEQASITVRDVLSLQTPRKLAQRLQENSNESCESIPQAKIAEFYPMSAAQKRMYFVCQMQPESITYNIPAAWHLDGKIDAEKLEAALEKMLQRHEILRTEFSLFDGEPIQKVRQTVAPNFEVVRDEETSENELIEQFIQPFDLSKAPLLRMKLIEREEGSLLLFDCHHIISDGVSEELFFSELAALYNGEALPLLQRQYKDYSLWMESRELSEQKAYWVGQFSDEIPVLDLPTDFNRPQEQSFDGALIYETIKPELMQQLKALCKRCGVTEYMAFLALTMVLLSKYSRQEDIVVGSAFSGRTHRDTENMLGMFVNTLALRGSVEGEKTFEEFLQQIKEISLKAYENQEYPFEDLLEAVEVRRDISRNPIFDVMLVVQNQEQASLQLNGATARRLTVEDRVSKFDLIFQMEETENGYACGLEYCTALFTERTVRRMLKHYIALLEQVTENASCKIAELKAITQEEESKILGEFNATQAEYPKNKTVMELFEAQVEARGDETALVFGSKCLTYRELNERINALAWKLREMGVKREGLVAILPKRSLQTVIGICAILKAGAAYVPIDPSYPEQRIEDILLDCKPKVILTYQASVQTQIPVIDLTDASAFEGKTENPPGVNEPTDAAYCIYTSGTTGRPKGVLIKHHSINNLVMNCDYMPFRKETRTIQTGQLVFDASTFEIWGTLLNGGCLHIITEDLLLDAERFAKYLKEQKINMQFVTTALFNQYVSYNAAMFDEVRSISFGGERASEQCVKQLMERNPKLQLTNAYGPTESTTIAVRFTVPENFEGTLPIGSPVHNTQIYILQGMQLCGIGIPGELCIAGDGLAKGYLNRPELTEEKFIPNPYGKGKLYRTGDLARWLPDGNIEFMGRIDEQVKIRGFRIELGEIESILRSIDSVQDCAVIVRKDAICAYVVGEEDQNLKEKLREYLPDYMLPSYIAYIDTIPLTTNGKLNKKALPEIEIKRTEEYTAPRDETEETVCQAMIKVLGLEKISVYDNFFEQGGHSLKSAQLVNLLHGAITIKDVFELKTAEKLAERIRGTAIEKTHIEKTEIAPNYPMSEAQKRLFIFEQIDETKRNYNVPYCFKLSGNFDEEKATKVWQELIKRHESLRTSFALEDGRFLQIVHKSCPFEFEHRTVTGRIEEELDRFLRPYDLTKLPLMRGALASDGEDRWLLLDFHHIIVDGHSAEILLEEFEKLYNGEALPEVRLQYRDYCAWMEKKDLSQQEAFWKKAYENELPEEDLPLDHKRTEKQDHRGALTYRAIENLTENEVAKFCQKYDITPYVFFTSVLTAMLGRYYDNEDVTLGTPVSCRTHADTESIVGMMVNTLSVRTSPKAEKTVKEYLSEVKEFIVGALSNQEYPLNTLSEAVQGQRANGRNAMFDVFFNYFDTKTMRTLKGKDFSAEQCRTDIGAGKFDLVFDVELQNAHYALVCNYKPSLFEKETAERMLQHFENMINWFLNHAEDSLGKASMLSQAEEEKLNAFNKTKQYKTNETFISLFRKQAERQKEKIALVCMEESVSYAKLDELTDRAASALIENGVQKEDIVGVMAGAGTEAFIGAIGAMKAGAAYMPIDPLYPEERIAHMITQSKCKIVLTQKETSLDAAKTIMISDAKKAEIKKLPEIGTDDLAYVIFTSGSTGKPKGVMIEHKALSNLIQWHNEYYEIKPEDRTTKYAGFGFDASVHEMYPQLAAGAEIHIIAEEMRMDLPAIRDYIERERINIGFFPTPVCEQFAKLKSTSLEKVITGGDKLKTCAEDYTIYNNYGPTEGTVLSTVFKVDKSYENIPIGKPIENVRVYIVNRSGQKQPIGHKGEIWLSGLQLARGYIGDEERTKERFLQDPFEENSRVYKTGDLGRWLPDGNIEYLGRNDEQVKVRGNRIELGEIEAAVCTHSEIAQCAAIVDTKSGSERIALFYQSQSQIDETELKLIVKKQLPSYMIPDAWVRVDKFRLTRNGKIDRKLLQNYDIGNTAKTEKQLPKTQTEMLIAEIWKETLLLDSIDVEDNFFELGGTSLSLAMMFTKLSEKFPNRLNIADVFANPSIRKLAEFIQSKSKKHCLIDGVLLKNECYGASERAQFAYKLPSTKNMQQLAMASLYALARMAEGTKIVLYSCTQNGEYDRIICDFSHLSTLSDVAKQMKIEKAVFTADTVRRKPDSKEVTCVITGNRQLTTAEQRLFDLSIGLNGLELKIRNHSKIIRDVAAKNMLKLLLGVMNMIN